MSFCGRGTFFHLFKKDDMKILLKWKLCFDLFFTFTVVFTYSEGRSKTVSFISFLFFVRGLWVYWIFVVLVRHDLKKSDKCMTVRWSLVSDQMSEYAFFEEKNDRKKAKHFQWYRNYSRITHTPYRQNRHSCNDWTVKPYGQRIRLPDDCVKWSMAPPLRSRSISISNVSVVECLTSHWRMRWEIIGSD